MMISWQYNDMIFMIKWWLVGAGLGVGGREAPVFRFRRKPISVTHLVIQFTRFKMIFSFYLASSSSFSITRKPMSYAPYHIFQMFKNYIIANLSKWEKNEKLKLAPHLAIPFTSLKIAVWKTIFSKHQNVNQAVKSQNISKPGLGWSRSRSSLQEGN